MCAAAHATATSAPDAAPGASCALAARLADEAETARLGAALGPALHPGDAVLLSGPLGAGKSALARAAVRARFAEPDLEVPSPSYTLVNVHEPADGGAPVWHADLYRLSEPEEILELGLAEAFDSAVVMVEWPDRLGPLRPARRIEIALVPVPGDDGARDLTLVLHGPGWDHLREALAPWR